MNIFGSRENDPMDDEINSVLEELATVSSKDDDYATMVRNLETLCRAKSAQGKSSIDPNTVLTILANIAGIVLILNHERINVIGSKALGLILKPKM